MKILITGGTVFVSKFAAAYFVRKGHEVFVLNRGTRPQVDGVKLIKADRSLLNNTLSGLCFDAIVDVCAYTQDDILNLLNSNIKFKDYVFISSSAVYAETLPQPFNEKQPAGTNSLWADYSTNKAKAESCLFAKHPLSYVIRPAYIYGPMQNLYREPFVFDCADANRKFYIPENGEMKLQFFYIEDLCRLIEIIITQKPENHIFNAGNVSPVTINTFAELCYQAAGKTPEKVYVDSRHDQRDYFCFSNYEYALDTSLLSAVLPEQTDLLYGLKESYKWYKQNPGEVNKKAYMDYIDTRV